MISLLGGLMYIRSSEDRAKSINLKILHFNDVYNVEGQRKEPVGGAARFATALKANRDENTLVIFSGDAFSPSMLSTITKGKHLVDVLNLFGIDCAVLGNHDFDFGVDNLLDCLDGCNFPWLNSNCYEKETMEMLGGRKRWQIIERSGIRFGLIGLVEEEWVATLSMVNEDDVLVKDFCEEGRALALELKTKEKCDLVIALTHMRWPNDLRLAKEVPEIDLVLGGHDHNFGVEQVDGRYVIKSGTDFRQLGCLTLMISSDKKKIQTVSVDEVIIDSEWTPDTEVAAIVQDNMGDLDEKMERVLGQVDVVLDSCCSTIRNKESNLGNWIAHIMLSSVTADLAIINAGSLRADCEFEPGNFTLRDLNLLLPIISSIMVLKASGQQIMETLENGVSQWPKLEGRFPQVAGVEFAFDPKKASGKRIDPNDIRVQGEPIDLKKSYRLAVSEYIAQGKDGFDVLLECPVLLDDENGPVLSNAVQNYFRTISVLKGFAKTRCPHRQGLLSRLQMKTLAHNKEESLPRSMSATERWKKIREAVIYDEEKPYLQIAPVVDGRIRIIE